MTRRGLALLIAGTGALLPCSEARAQPLLAAVVPVQARGCELSVTLRADKSRFLLGEPVFLSFRVTTGCDTHLSVLDGGDYRNKFGRAESYRLSAVSAAGQRLAGVDAGFQFGGLIGPRALSKSRPFEKRILIAHWVDFPAPGVYTLTIDKTLYIGEAMTPGEKDKSAVPVKVTTIVEVLPASAAKTGAVIEALGRQLLTDNEQAASEAERALQMIHDERVVPYFSRLVAGSNRSLRVSALWGLRPYATDEALAALVQALTVGELRLAAAQALAENPHPMAWESLWALRSDADANIRLTVLHRLAKRNEPDTQTRLTEFAGDPSAMIEGEARRYLRERKQAR